MTFLEFGFFFFVLKAPLPISRLAIVLRSDLEWILTRISALPTAINLNIQYVIWTNIQRMCLPAEATGMGFPETERRLRTKTELGLASPYGVFGGPSLMIGRIQLRW